MIAKDYISEKVQKALSDLGGVQGILETANDELTDKEAIAILDYLEYAKNFIDVATKNIENNLDYSRFNLDI